MNLHYAYIISLAFLILSTDLLSQQTIDFYKLNKNDGLSDNQVTAIAKDNDGYMWFGTRNGLNRYNGYDFKHYFPNGENNGLPSNYISELFLAKNGDLWIGTVDEGFCRYNKADDSFVRYNQKEGSNYLADDQFMGFTQTSDSSLIIATMSELFLYDNDADSVIDFSNRVFGNTTENEEAASILQLTSHGNTICIATDRKQLLLHNLVTTQTEIHELNVGDPEMKLEITDMETIGSTIYFGGVDMPFFSFDLHTKVVIILPDLLGTDIIRDFAKGEKDLLWIATVTGVHQFNYSTQSAHLYNADVDNQYSMSAATASSVFIDTTLQMIWAGTSQSGINFGLLKKPFHYADTDAVAFYNEALFPITAILLDNDGILWTGAAGNTIEVYDSKNKKKERIKLNAIGVNKNSGTIFDLYQTRSGKIYSCSWRGGIQVFNKRTRRFEPLFGEKYVDKIGWVDARDMVEDQQGRIWVTMHGSGVYVIDPETGTVEKITGQQDGGTLTLPWVNHIAIDRNGFAWASSAWGLNRISVKDFSVKHYFSTDSEHSLLDNSTDYLTVDHENNVWVACNKGLNLYDRNSDRFFHITTADGFTDNQFTNLIQVNDHNYWGTLRDEVFSFELGKNENGQPLVSNLNTFDLMDGLKSVYFEPDCFAYHDTGLVYLGGNKGIDFFNPSETKPILHTPVINIENIAVNGSTVYPGTPKGPHLNDDNEIVLSHRESIIQVSFAAIDYLNNNRINYSYRFSPGDTAFHDIGTSRNILFSSVKPGHHELFIKVNPQKDSEFITEKILKFYIVPPFWQRIWFYILMGVLIPSMIYLIILRYTRNIRARKEMLESLVKERTEELVVQSENLEIANEKLEKINSTKDKFFSIIAHDLKNPLNTIQGFSQLLRSNITNYSEEKTKKIVGHLNDATNSANELLNNLLFWSRSQRGLITLNWEYFNLTEIFEQNIRLFEPSAIQKQITLSFDARDDDRVYADKTLTDTIVRNLVNNAIKFTESGGQVTISCKSMKKTFTQVEVTDTGVGISAEKVEMIMNAEGSIISQGTNDEIGTGLGLMLCREFVNKLGGKLNIESQPGSGTTIMFTIPNKRD